MKNIVKLVLILMVSFLNAQNNLGKSDDIARIALTSFIPENILESTPHARKLFNTKLGQITTRNGMGSAKGSNNRFIISGDLNVVTKDILPGPPTKYVVTIEVTLAVGDGMDGKLFASEYIEFKGSGNSEDKAFISAIKKINPRHRDVQAVLTAGKEKIIEYYNANCDFISKEAQTLADSRKFDQAIFTLNQVPQVTKECFDKSMDMAVVIMNQKLEFECQERIAEAKALLSANDFESASQVLNIYSKGMDCYSEVEVLLTQINTGICSKYLGEAKGYWANRNSSGAAAALANINASSPCYAESSALAAEIAGLLDEREQREWDLNYEKYKDDLEIRNRKLDNEASRIKAVRDVGVAYGENQPKKITYSPIIN